MIMMSVSMDGIRDLKLHLPDGASVTFDHQPGVLVMEVKVEPLKAPYAPPDIVTKEFIEGTEVETRTAIRLVPHEPQKGEPIEQIPAGLVADSILKQVPARAALRDGRSKGFQFLKCDRCLAPKPGRWFKLPDGDTSKTCKKCREGRSPGPVVIKACPTEIIPLETNTPNQCIDCGKLVDLLREPFVGGICFSCTAPELKKAAMDYFRKTHRQKLQDAGDPPGPKE